MYRAETLKTSGVAQIVETVRLPAWQYRKACREAQKRGISPADRIGKAIRRDLDATNPARSVGEVAQEIVALARRKERFQPDEPSGRAMRRLIDTEIALLGGEPTDKVCAPFYSDLIGARRTGDACGEENAWEAVLTLEDTARWLLGFGIPNAGTGRDDTPSSKWDDLKPDVAQPGEHVLSVALSQGEVEKLRALAVRAGAHGELEAVTHAIIRAAIGVEYAAKSIEHRVTMAQTA